MEPKFVKITPIRYDNHGKYPRIVVYRHVKISKHLTQGIMDKIVQQLKTKQKITAIMNPDNFIFVQYGTAPMIIFSLDDNQVLTTQTVINHYGMRRVQQQATIILRWLKKFGYAKFKGVTISAYRLGKTIDDVKEIVEAYGRLWNKTIIVEEGIKNGERNNL
jgi:hypothetical protein